MALYRDICVNLLGLLLRRWRLLCLRLSLWLGVQNRVRVRRRRLGDHRVLLRHGLLVVDSLLADGLLAHLLLAHWLLAQRLRLGHGLLAHRLLAHRLRVQRLLAHGLGAHGLLRDMLLAHRGRKVAQRSSIWLSGHLSVGGCSRTRARHG